MKQRLLVEGVDYYLNEKGLVVLTAHHHLQRGYCCGLSCLHCPYQYEAVPEPKRSLLLANRNEKESGSP
jgi:hypothetical protein